jgi:hypothetical protein
MATPALSADAALVTIWIYRAMPDQDHTALLPGLKSQGAARLSAGHRQGDPAPCTMKTLDNEEKEEDIKKQYGS